MDGSSCRPWRTAIYCGGEESDGSETISGVSPHRMVSSTDSSPSPWTLTARWVFPMSGPPIADGVVSIAGERILAVGPRAAQRADVDLGDVAVLPGLVNAHTHL